MWEILNVLRRISCGECKSVVARATVHSRKTVRHYLSVAVKHGQILGVEDPNEELAVGVFRHLPHGHHIAEGHLPLKNNPRSVPSRSCWS